MEKQAVPNAAMHQVFAGRATLLVPRGVELRITKAEVNEVELHAEPGAQDFEKKWAERVNNIRVNRANPTGFSSVDREWPGDHTVQFDTTRGSLNARTWERWGVLGNSIVKGNTVAPLDKADEAFRAVADVFKALLPDGKPSPGDFRFDGGIARVPFLGAERINADWHESVAEAGSKTLATLDFTLITDALSQAGTLAEVQSDMQQRLAQTKQRAAVDGAQGVTVEEIRSGPVTTHGLQGIESVVIYTDKPTGKKSFGAQWLSPGVAENPYAPAVDLSAAADNFNPADLPFLLAQWSAALQSLQFPSK